MNDCKPISDPEELRIALGQRMAEIENLRGKPNSRPILILPLLWHKEFLRWVKGEGPMPPKEINSKILLDENNKLKLDIKWKIDFEIIESDIFTLISEVFTYPNPIFRRISIYPFTGATSVLLDPIILQFITEQGIKTKTTGHDWNLYYMKRLICLALRIINSDYVFLSPDDDAIPDDWTVGQYRDIYGTQIKLARKEQEIPDLNTNKLVASMPRPQVNKLLPLDIKNTISTPTKPMARVDIDQPGKGDSMSQIIASRAKDIVVPKAMGLNNLGNTCYFNSALQAISHIRIFYEFVLSDKFNSSINKTNEKGSKGVIAMAFKDFMKSMTMNDKNVISPRDFRLALTSKFSEFANYEQHDAQEVLGSIIDGLHEDLCYDEVDSGITPRTMNIRTRYPGTKPSFIENLFSGMLYSSLYCPSCKKTVTVYDPFTFLSVPVKNRFFGSVKLIDCLKNFEESYKLDEDNKWECSNCKQKVCATTKMGVERSPKILIIHLKRFEYSAHHCVKIETEVEFPNQIQLRDFCKNDRGTAKLVSVVYHSGTSSGGHYTTASLDQSCGIWYYYNDSRVSKIDIRKVHSQNAYILIYQKESSI